MTDFRQAHPNGVILALDQMSAYLQATLTRVWSPIGQTPYVWVTPQRDCLHFYGALNVLTTFWSTLRRVFPIAPSCFYGIVPPGTKAKPGSLSRLTRNSKWSTFRQVVPT